MGADEIAVYRPALHQMLAAGEGWCASFTDEADEDAWVQVSDDLLNFAYPCEDAPEREFVRRGLWDLANLETVSWEPGKFATLRLVECHESAMAQVVDRVFTDVLGRAPGFAVSVQVFEAI